MGWRVGLYKILLYFEAFVHKSIILLLPTPTCIARTILRNIRRPSDPPFVCDAQYHIGNGNIV